MTEAAGDDKEAAARAALEAQYQAAPAGQSLDAATTQPSVAATAPAAVAKPAPKTKKEKLADLLELYKDNSITPREYHEQRAMIMAGN